MRTWLFYKVIPREGGAQIEFRRVENGGVTNFLPEKIRGTIAIPLGISTDKAAQDLVLQSGWVGPAARPFDDEVGKIVLRGRW